MYKNPANMKRAKILFFHDWQQSKGKQNQNMAGNLKHFRSLLREYKLISDSSRIPGEFQVLCYFKHLYF